MTKYTHLNEALDLAAAILTYPSPAAPHVARVHEELQQASQAEDLPACAAHLRAAVAAIDEALKAAGYEA